MPLRKLFCVDSSSNGKGSTLFAWQKEGTFLAVVGSSRRVSIVDRQGNNVHQFTLPQPGNPIALEWDCDGEILAIAQEKTSSVNLWSNNTKKLETMDIGMKDLTFMKWAPAGPYLAIGNQKGGVVIYNKQTFKKNPIVGKHAKRITCGTWNSKNLLALSGDDRQLTISNEEGTTLEQHPLRADPSQIYFADMKVEGRAAGQQNTVSVNVGGRNLFLASAGGEPPKELSFSPQYGTITSYLWFGDCYILIGFTSGTVIVVSTHEKEIGQEVSALKIHRDNLADVCYSKALGKGGSCGDNCVRVFDVEGMSEQKSEKYEMDNEFGALEKVAFTEDGQIITVSSRNGNVYSFLAKVPVLSDSYSTNVVYLSSLRELCIRDIPQEQDICKITLDIEPSFVALGPGTVAAGMNNQAQYFTFSGAGASANRLGVRSYGFIIEKVKLSTQFTAVLGEGKVVLQSLQDEQVQKTLPERPTSPVTCMAIAENFFIYATQAGNISVYSLVDHQVICDYNHTCGIKQLVSNLSGTRYFIIDDGNMGHVFNPGTELLTPCENFATTTEKVLWDPLEYGVIIGVERKHLATYVYAPNSRFGSSLGAVLGGPGSIKEGQPLRTHRPHSSNPILAFKGDVVCQLQSGALAHVNLVSHQSTNFLNTPDKESFTNNLALNRLTEAMTVCETEEQLERLGARALDLLDIDMAIRVYRRLGRVAYVQYLEGIRNVHEKNLLMGHISTIFRNFNDAQNFFLRSSCPILALEMRRDMMHWDEALSLAKTMAPSQVPVISKEYGQQLEFRGEYRQALEHFRNASLPVPTQAREEDAAQLQRVLQHNEACLAGTARCMIRTGDIVQGTRMAMQSENVKLKLECAGTLEDLKQYNEAATLYEAAEEYEKAVTLHVMETKQLRLAQKLLPKIKSRNVLVLYARAREKEGSFQDAAQAYASAEDFDNVVRIKVEYLNDLHEAYVLVRRTKSAEAAALVANVCRKKNEMGAAVEFLLLAKKTQEAFDLAQSHNAMANFEKALIQQVPLKDGMAPLQNRDEFLLIAKYYDQKAKHELAGDYYHIAGQHTLALENYIKVGSEEAVNKAIEVVGRSRSDSLTNTFLDYLMGETDGIPKDPNYIFRLYMALKCYEKAAKSAVMIANKEQELGNYRASHKILVDTCLVLQEKGIRVPSDLRRSLSLVHSYIIVKHLVKPMDEHITATRMLLRVARNIQKFPAHVGVILTSCVLECLKTEFKQSAYQYACMIVQNEAYRSQLNEKHRKKIEAIVRKRGKEELTDPPEANSLCPFCGIPVPETTLECSACKNALPYCIVTGKHMTLEEWSQCPHCKFPALFTPFLKLVREGLPCPMCEQHVDPIRVSKIVDPNLKGTTSA